VTKASTTSPIVTNAERHSRLAYSLFFAALLACSLYVAFIAEPAVRASAQELSGENRLTATARPRLVCSRARVLHDHPPLLRA
jgi:hypothetical protein